MKLGRVVLSCYPLMAENKLIVIVLFFPSCLPLSLQYSFSVFVEMFLSLSSVGRLAFGCLVISLFELRSQMGTLGTVGVS